MVRGTWPIRGAGPGLVGRGSIPAPGSGSDLARHAPSGHGAFGSGGTVGKRCPYLVKAPSPSRSRSRSQSRVPLPGEGSEGLRGHECSKDVCVIGHQSDGLTAISPADAQ